MRNGDKSSIHTQSTGHIFHFSTLVQGESVELDVGIVRISQGSEAR